MTEINNKNITKAKQWPTIIWTSFVIEIFGGHWEKK
jgi:hypothetical protein